MTDAQKRVAEFLAKAKEAADVAATYPAGSAMHESWLRICFAYRDMARLNGYKE